MKGLQMFSHDGTVHVKLYNTVVFTQDKLNPGARFTKGGYKIAFSHGGWVTMSACKAINKGLEAAGIDGKCYRKAGVMYIDAFGETYEVSEALSAGTKVDKATKKGA